MKKILFALVCALTLVLTSCWKETGYSYTSTSLYVVTIDRDAMPPRLIPDRIGGAFKPDNLTDAEQLSLYGLQDADRAIATMTLKAEDYTQTLTLEKDGTSPIKVNPVWNAPLPESDKYNALVDLYPLQLSISYPTVWLAGGRYVNIAPVIRSVGIGTYYLQPTAVYGDTLRFDMKAEYTLNDQEKDIVDFINFDLFTLTDTVAASATAQGIVDKMKSAIEANDSVMVMVVSDFFQSYHKVDTLADGTVKYETRDTIVKYPAIAGYSSALKWNL